MVITQWFHTLKKYCTAVFQTLNSVAPRDLNEPVCLAAAALQNTTWRFQARTSSHLLSLLDLQLHPHAQGPEGVFEGLPQGLLH